MAGNSLCSEVILHAERDLPWHCGGACYPHCGELRPDWRYCLVKGLSLVEDVIGRE